MTVSSTTRTAGPYIGTGTVTTYPFSFVVFKNTDVLVQRVDLGGNISNLVYGSDYTVTLNSNQSTSPGGTIALTAALPTGYQLVMTSQVPALQGLDIQNPSAWYPDVVMTQFDYLTVLIQQILTTLAGSLQLPLAYAPGVSPQLPAPVANKLIGWNDAATGLQNFDAGTLASIVAFGTANADIFTGDGSTTVFTLSANPGAQANLDVAIAGATQLPGIDYVWSGNQVVTFTNPPANGAKVLLRYLRALPQGTSDSGATIWSGTTSYPTGTVGARLGQTVSVKDPPFNAKGDGVTDDTAAIAAAYAYVKGLSLYYDLVFPPGRYLTESQFVFTDCYFGSFKMEGACFIGGSKSASYDSVFKIVNAENFKIHGAWSVTADSHFTGPTRDPNRYANGFYLTTAPGGAFTAIAAFVDIYGLTTHHCANGVKVGEYTNDTQIAEITFHGLMTPFCPSGASVSGSQAVVTFVGSLIDSNTVTNFSPPLTSPVYCGLLVEGSEVNIVGGEIGFHSGTPAAAAAIEIQPCSSSTFGNQYGSVQIDNANLETTTTLALISNPRSLSAPGSTLSGFSVTNCKGYFGNYPTNNIQVIDVEDATYAGAIAVPDGNLFYYNAGTRTVSQINCSIAPSARVSVGKTAFNVASGFLDWMNGVAGGQLIHALELGFYAYVNSGTQPTGDNAVIWNSVSTSGVYARYRGLLSTSTGIITTPTGNPPRLLKIEAAVQVGTSNNAGNIYVYDITNGRIVAFGVIAGGLAMIVATIPNPSPGQQFSVHLNVPNTIAWGGSVTNNLAVYIAN